MSLLEQNIIRKERVDKKVTEWEFEASNNKEYKVKAMWDSAIYANKTKDPLPELYYLIV